jgi:hypothetical protein
MGKWYGDVLSKQQTQHGARYSMEPSDDKIDDACLESMRNYQDKLPIHHRLT